MIFIFKRKKIILDCFTYRESVLNYYPISKASKFLPEWWKNTPKNFEDDFINLSTIKKCDGIINNFRNGFIMPLWCDLSIGINDGLVKWQFADFQTEATSHHTKQWETFVSPKDAFHLKIITPWRFKTKSNINFLTTNPFWNNELFKNYEIATGAHGFKYNYQSNINMFLNLKSQRIFINQNTPLVHYYALTDNEVEIKNHLISFDEFSNITSVFVFQGIVKKTKKILDLKEKKCPFNFK